MPYTHLILTIAPGQGTGSAQMLCAIEVQHTLNSTANPEKHLHLTVLEHCVIRRFHIAVSVAPVQAQVHSLRSLFYPAESRLR